jgi:hypothetical protein
VHVNKNFVLCRGEIRIATRLENLGTLPIIKGLIKIFVKTITQIPYCSQLIHFSNKTIACQWHFHFSDIVEKNSASSLLFFKQYKSYVNTLFKHIIIPCIFLIGTCQQKFCFVSWRNPHCNTFRKFRHVAYYKRFDQDICKNNYTNTLLQPINTFFRIKPLRVNGTFIFLI